MGHILNFQKKYSFETAGIKITNFEIKELSE